MSHYPRIPVRFLEANDELLDIQKSHSAGQSHESTNYKVTEAAYPCEMRSAYRSPPDRINGNAMFRRNPDATLDLDYAKHKVIEAVHKFRDGAPLNSLEEAALTVLFPLSFLFMDSAVAASVCRVNLKVTPHECDMLSRAVAMHLEAEMAYAMSNSHG